MFRFVLKLKQLRVALKAWNIITVGNIFQNLILAEKELKSKKLAFRLLGRDEDLISLIFLLQGSGR